MNSYEILDKGVQRLATELERISPRLPEPHLSVLKGLGVNARTLCAIAWEADQAEQESPNHEVLLMELLGEIQRSTVRKWSATPDQAGVDAAKLALGEMAPTLAPQPGDLASQRRSLLEAVRAEGATCTLELYKGDLGTPIIETIENYPVMGRPMIRDAYDLEDGRRARVKSVRFAGRHAIARAAVFPPLPQLEPGEDWF